MQEFTARREAAAATNPLAGAAEPKRSVKQRLMHEALRLGLMFLYLWVVFGLFVLHERIVRGELGLGFHRGGLEPRPRAARSAARLCGDGRSSAVRAPLEATNGRTGAAGMPCRFFSSN